MDAKYSQVGNHTFENKLTLPAPLGIDFTSVDISLFIVPQFICVLHQRNLYKILNCILNIVNERIILKRILKIIWYVVDWVHVAQNMGQ
jgi:hypothetical protein